MTGKQKKGSKPSDPGVGLFATSSGPRAVQSRARVQVLSSLAEHELPFEEIVKRSGRAKSTVSVHLQGLVRDGIVSQKPDPDDSRKKIFSLAAPCIGGIAAKKPVIRDNAEIITKLVSGPDPFRFYRLMFRTIRVSLLKEGINIDPVLQNAGYQVGERVYSSIAAPDLEQMLKNSASFWKRNSLGVIEIESTAPLVMKIYDCFECGSLPQLGRPACSFDSGVLGAIFTRHFRRPQRVDETACYAMGDDHCRFVIAPVEPVLP